MKHNSLSACALQLIQDGQSAGTSLSAMRLAEQLHVEVSCLVSAVYPLVVAGRLKADVQRVDGRVIDIEYTLGRAKRAHISIGEMERRAPRAGEILRTRARLQAA